MDGVLRNPEASTSRSPVTVPPEVSTRHRLAAASHRAPVTSVPNRMRRLTSVRSATARRYSSISGWGAKVRVHSGLGADDREYSSEGTSHWHPG